MKTFGPMPAMSFCVFYNLYIMELCCQSYVWQIYLPFHISILIFFTSQGWAEQSNTFGQYYWSTSKRVVKILGVFHHHTTQTFHCCVCVCRPQAGCSILAKLDFELSLFWCIKFNQKLRCTKCKNFLIHK